MSGRLLIVNADDFGLTPGVCEGVLDAYERGIVTSTSALVVAPAWDRYAEALASSGIGVGAHLCAVGEDPPLLSASEVPTLVDARGRFPRSWPAFMARSSAGRVDSDDLRREFGAQLERLAQAGIRPTHVDSHQHLHQWPQVSKVVIELAGSQGIAAARVMRTNQMHLTNRWWWSWRTGGVRTLGVWYLARRFAALCRRNGIAVPDGADGLDHAGRMDVTTLMASIGLLGMRPVVTAELSCHPGLGDDPDRARYQWDYRWPDEHAALVDPRARSTVEQAGFTLGDFGDLASWSTRHAAT
ncbi:MAG: ChbG/HpnK family deacetylase [Acidimicrobiales bacterium]